MVAGLPVTHFMLLTLSVPSIGSLINFFFLGYRLPLGALVIVVFFFFPDKTLKGCLI